MNVLLATSAGVEGVVSQPAPAALVTGLGRGTLKFTLRVWTESADWGSVRSRLAVALRDSLAAAGIEVPRPQSDLHLVEVSEGAAQGLRTLRCVAHPDAQSPT